MRQPAQLAAAARPPRIIALALCAVTTISGMIVLVESAPSPRPAALQGAGPDPLQQWRRERLGESIFMDRDLSEPRGTSCAGCHEPQRAFSGNHGSTIGVAMGSTGASYGLRNTPTITYASFAPPLSVENEGPKLEVHGGQSERPLDRRPDDHRSTRCHRSTSQTRAPARPIRLHQSFIVPS